MFFLSVWVCYLFVGIWFLSVGAFFLSVELYFLSVWVCFLSVGVFFLLVGVFSLSVGVFSLSWGIFFYLFGYIFYLSVYFFCWGIFSIFWGVFSICWGVFFYLLGYVFYLFGNVFYLGMFSISLGMFSICWAIFSNCLGIFSVCLGMFSLCWGVFELFPVVALEYQASPHLSQEGADVSSISCKQSDGGGSALVQLEELCRTLMGHCSLEVLMNNGRKAAPCSVQSPSPFGMIFSSSLGIPGAFLRTLEVKGTINNISSSAWAWWAAPVEFQPGEAWQGFLREPQKFHRAEETWIFQHLLQPPGRSLGWSHFIGQLLPVPVWEISKVNYGIFAIKYSATLIFEYLRFNLGSLKF